MCDGSTYPWRSLLTKSVLCFSRRGRRQGAWGTGGGLSRSHSTPCPWFPQSLTLPQPGKDPTLLRPVHPPLVGTQKSGIRHPFFLAKGNRAFQPNRSPSLKPSPPVPHIPVLSVTLAGFALRSALWCLQRLRMLLGEYRGRLSGDGSQRLPGKGGHLPHPTLSHLLVTPRGCLPGTKSQ